MIVTFNKQQLLNFLADTILNPYLIEFSYPKNPKMCDPILVTLLKMQPHSSQSSRENATPSSGTSPLASYKEVPPPRENDPSNVKTGLKHIICFGLIYMQKMRCNLCMSCIYNQKAPCFPITKKLNKKFQMSSKIE